MLLYWFYTWKKQYERTKKHDLSHETLDHWLNCLPSAVLCVKNLKEKPILKIMIQKIKDHWKEYLVVFALGAATIYCYQKYQTKNG